MENDKSTRLSRLLCLGKIISQGVWINRFQLILTTLTMSFGSLGLALTVFLGGGALNVLWADVDDLLGSWVVARAVPEEQVMKTRLQPDFNSDDLGYIKKNLDIARLVTPTFSRPMKVRYKDKSIHAAVDGITPDLQEESLFHPIMGRALSSAAHQALTWECMVTEPALEEFGLDLDDDPTIMVDNHAFKVVGVVKSVPRNFMRFRSRVIISYRMARNLWMEPGSVGNILVAWHKTDDMGRVVEKIKETLDRHRGPGSYFLDSSQFQIQSGKKIVNNFIVVGTAQSLFCIVIASIGILNVMLTNVARRTHEFAIRIVMGANRRDILFVVLSESIFIGLVGAFLGLVVAVLIAPILGDVMASGIQEASKLKPDYTMNGFLIPLMTCGLSSLVAGLIPAIKARKLDILSALRASM